MTGKRPLNEQNEGQGNAAEAHQAQLERPLEERMRAIILEELRENLNPLRDRLLVEEATRKAMEEHIGRQVDKTLNLERLLEQRLDGALGADHERLNAQRQALARLTESLRGPQDLLEKAGAQQGDAGTHVGRVSRPPFNQEEAKWNLPRLNEQKHDHPRKL
jgi:hypothetical protein